MWNKALFAAILMVASPLRAQDIVGLEDCAQARGPDKKAGCLQSNVEFLHRLIRKNDAAANAKLRDQAAALADAIARLEQLRAEVDRLKAALDRLDKKVPDKQP
jgi:hypothetical protein